MTQLENETRADALLVRPPAFDPTKKRMNGRRLHKRNKLGCANTESNFRLLRFWIHAKYYYARLARVCRKNELQGDHDVDPFDSHNIR